VGKKLTEKLFSIYDAYVLENNGIWIPDFMEEEYMREMCGWITDELSRKYQDEMKPKATKAYIQTGKPYERIKNEFK
jgi:hypothetical protein